MAKARSRAAARKVKDRWKAKIWYNILAPPAFDNVTVSDTLADKPDNLLGRVTAVSLQDLTGDFRKSHIKLFFKVHKVEESNAMTQFTGHTLTSDYLRRMIRRRRSKIDGVYDVSTRDGAVIRVKPFATTDKRVQNSQKKIVREAMSKTLSDSAKNSTLSEFVRDTIDGKTGSAIYKNCKKLYPVKRVEIHKTEVISQPTIMIEDKKPEVTEQPEEPAEIKEKKPKKEKAEKTDKEVKEPETKEEPTPEIEKPIETVEESEEIKEEPKQEEEMPSEPEKTENKPDKPVKPKPKDKKTPVTKTTTKKAAAKKPAAKKTTAKKKTPAKKKTTTKKKEE